GYLAGGAAPFDVAHPESGYVLAFRGLPLILLMSALTRLLYHWGLLQHVVRGFAFIFQRAFGIGGPLGTVAAAQLVLAMIEARLLRRHGPRRALRYDVARHGNDRRDRDGALCIDPGAVAARCGRPCARGLPDERSGCTAAGAPGDAGRVRRRAGGRRAAVR